MLRDDLSLMELQLKRQERDEAETDGRRDSVNLERWEPDTQQLPEILRASR